MVFAPLDLHKVEFKRGFRGYSEDEVDKFLDKLTADYETIYKENIDLKEMLVKKDGNIIEYKQIEDTLKNALVLAEKTATDVKKVAQQEADNIREDARRQAAAIVQKAKEDAETILLQYKELTKEAQLFKTKFKSLVESQLQVVNGYLPDEIVTDILAAHETTKVSEQPEIREDDTIIMQVVE